MSAVSYIDQTDTPMTSGIQGGDTYEMLAEHTVQILKLVRQTMESYLDSLSAAEKTRAEHAIQQMNDYIEQLERQRKTSGLQAFLKALGPIGLIIAALAAILCPTPMTIALLVVAVFMFLEPLISKAAGAQSIIEKGMGQIFNALNEVMGPIAAAVVAAILMIIIAVAATAAIGAGISMFTSSAALATMEAMAQFIKELPKLLNQAFASSLDPAKSQKLQAFFEFSQSVILAAQAGVQIDMALINFEIAKLMHSFELEQAVIDHWLKIIEIVSKDLSGSQELLQFLQSLMPQLFDQGPSQ